MFQLTHRSKASLHSSAAVEHKTAAAPPVKRPQMYFRLPSSSSAAGAVPSRRGVVVMQLLAQAALLCARCCFATTVLILLGWLLCVGPLQWRLQVGYDDASQAFMAMYESRVLGSMLLRDLVFLWALPAAMALSAVAALVLQPLVVLKRRKGPLSANILTARWASRLLPPRCVP